MARIPDATELGARPTPVSRRSVAVVRNPDAVADAVVQVGRIGQQAATELAEVQQRQEAARAGREFAEMVGEVEQEANRRRADAEPGAAAHTQLVETDTDRRTSAFLARIRDPRVRESFEVNVAQLRSRVISGEDAWAMGQRRELAVANVEQTTNILENSLRTNPSAEALQNYLDVARSTILGTDDISGNVAEALIRRRQSRLARAYLQGLKETNPTAALEVIQRGALNQYLDADDQQPLLDSTQAEIARREAEGRRELSALQSQARAELNIAERRLRDEDPTVTEADLDRWQTMAVGAELGPEAYDITRARIIYQTNREFSTATALEVQQAVTQLESRIAQQGANASPDDVIRRDRLQAILARRQQRDQNDPMAGHAARGGDVPALDFANPAAIRGRIQAARAAERETGYFVPLRPAEVPLLQAQLATPEGRMQVIDSLANVRAVDPAAAIAMARRIAPQDAALRHAMRMGPDARGLVARGAEARSLLPASMDDGDGQMRSFNQITQNWFSSHIAPSLMRLEVDFSEGTLDAARAIYAERMRQAGRLGQAEFDEGAFAAAIDTALGRTNGGRGGMGRWNFGPRSEDGDFPGVLLPGGMNQAEFSRRFANLPRPDARGNRNWNGAANGTPIWGDGSRVNNEDIRRRFVPVAVGDGIYQFRYGNQVLHRREGGPFQINIRRVPMGAAPLQQQPVSLRRDGQPTPVRPALPPRPVYTPRNTSRPGG